MLSYYCIDRRGQVVYWDHDGATEERWPDLAAWIVEVWVGESEDDQDGEDDQAHRDETDEDKND